MKKQKSICFILLLVMLCSLVTIPLKVNAASSIKLSKTSLTLYVGQTSSLKVSGTSKKITWVSSNKKIATVSTSGKVTAKKTGTATITAKVSSKTLKCKITVKTPTLNKTKTSLVVGQTTTLKLTGATIKSIKSSNTKIATVSTSGKITAKKAGKCTVTVTDTLKRTYKCSVTVINPTKKLALKAYYNFLKSYKFTFDGSEHGFYLAYINNDSIPELIIGDGNCHAASASVYAYINGKVTHLGDFGEYGEMAYKAKSGLIQSYYMGMGNEYIGYFKWTGSKVSTAARFESLESYNKNGTYIGQKYYVNKKVVSNSTYVSKTKAYAKGLTYVTWDKYYKVTSSVMKKVLLQ